EEHGPAALTQAGQGAAPGLPLRHPTPSVRSLQGFPLGLRARGGGRGHPPSLYATTGAPAERESLAEPSDRPRGVLEPACFGHFTGPPGALPPRACVKPRTPLPGPAWPNPLEKLAAVSPPAVA